MPNKKSAEKELRKNIKRKAANKTFADKLKATVKANIKQINACLLYTSDAADDLLCVDLGGRRIIKKKKTNNKTSIKRTMTRRNNNIKAVQKSSRTSIL